MMHLKHKMTVKMVGCCSAEESFWSPCVAQLSEIPPHCPKALELFPAHCDLSAGQQGHSARADAPSRGSWMSLEILGCSTAFPRIFQMLWDVSSSFPCSSWGPLLTELPSVHHWLFFPSPAPMTPAFPIPSQPISQPGPPFPAPQGAGAHRTGGDTAGVWWQHRGRTCPMEQRECTGQRGPVTQGQEQQCPGRICCPMGCWACFGGHLVLCVT